MVPQAEVAVLTEPCNFAAKAGNLHDISLPIGPGRSLRGREMFRFNGYTLDIARTALRGADHDVQLRPKSFEVLRYLLENADRTVAKEELMEAVWPNVVVTDHVLAHCVSEVRQAIGDQNQANIKTLPRRGYRFSAPVVRVATGAASPATAREMPPQSAGEKPTVPDRMGDRPSVAVLPFANLGGDPQQDYFSDGITEDIIAELSRFSELLVIARNSSFQYRGRSVDIRQVGRELDARYVVEGSVRRSGDRIRIVAQLIDAVTGAHRWAERYDRQLHDVFALQDEVARAIVAILAAHVNRAETERALLKPPAAWEANEYYLRGAEAYFLHFSRRTKDSLYKARRLLEQSLAIDPDYARAAAALSDTHYYAFVEPYDGDYLSPAALDRALELAQAAVRLDVRLPQARAQLGSVLNVKGQHDAAIAEFEEAFALNPNFIDTRYAYVLMCAGAPARAIELLEASIRLDPFAPFSSGLMGLANYMRKRYPEAVRWLRECALRQPNMQMPRIWLASAYAQSGQIEEARREAAEVLGINPGFTIEGYKRSLLPFKDPKDLEHRLDGMRKAGLPES